MGGGASCSRAMAFEGVAITAANRTETVRAPFLFIELVLCELATTVMRNAAIPVLFTEKLKIPENLAGNEQPFISRIRRHKVARGKESKKPGSKSADQPDRTHYDSNAHVAP
jgi:hypothetical protein